MGNSSLTTEADRKNQEFLNSLTLIKKENLDNLGWHVDFYRSKNPEFDEAQLIHLDIPLEGSYDSDKSVEDVNEDFKKKLAIRKQINCRFLTQLKFFSVSEVKAQCFDTFLIYHITLEYSDENLYKIINDSHTMRSSVGVPIVQSDSQLHNLLLSIATALSVLYKNNSTHGFVTPVNVLIYNKHAPKPLYKLVDVSLVSKYLNSFERISRESDHTAPLSPRLLQAYAAKNYGVFYDKPDDIWSFGITALCFLFNEDFNSFYDWNTFKLKEDKIDFYLQNLLKINYNQKLIRMVSSMLALDEFSRIKLDQILETLQEIN